MAFQKNQVANPTGEHTPASKHVATAHKKVRAKGKQYLPDAVDNLIKAVLDPKGELSLPQKVAASKDLIKLVFEAEKYLERAQGITGKNKGNNEGSGEDDGDDFMPVIKMTAD
jgi:hypothetical protein